MTLHARMAVLITVLVLGMVSLRCEGTAVVKSKTHKPGHQKVGTAVISDLSGNVKNAGDHYNISGTNVWLRMYAKNSWPSTLLSCDVLLGNSMLACGMDSVKVSPSAVGETPDILPTDSAGNWQSAVSPGYVKFDSTAELPSGTQGDLNVYLFRGDGALFHSKDPIPAVRLYNKAYVLGSWKPGADAQADYVHQKCEAINYSASPVDTANCSDSKQTICNNLPSYTIFYFAGEGGDIRDNLGQDFYFYDCIAKADGHELYASSEIQQAAVQGKSVQPYYNFVQLDTCFSGENATMAEGFGILNWGTVLPDRAYLGWKGFYQGIPGITTGWTPAFWDNLVAGRTVLDAAREASLNRIDPATFQVYGDRNTVLHGVYCGTVKPNDN